jgi:hypothetical protein
MKTIAMKAQKRLGRLGSILLLPVSVLPLIGAIPFVINAYRSYKRYYQSPPLPAPANVLSAAQRRAFKPLPSFTGAIPVLTYHGINNLHDGYSISQRAFAGQMQMLELAGCHTVSIAQYDRFQHGDSSGLPARPILITFDDGRLDSYRGATNVLAREGFRATMFIITGPITDGNPLYLDWTELHRMRDSGRWDVQPLAYRGDVQIAVDPGGDQRPFYAMRRWLRSTGEESFADYQRRVANDLFTLADQFRAQGIPIYSMAVPYGDYGQLDGGNDPRIVPFTVSLMRAQFGTVFVQDDYNNPPYSTPTGGPQERWEAYTSTTPAQLYGWLRAHDPVMPGGAQATHSSAKSPINHRTK